MAMAAAAGRSISPACSALNVTIIVADRPKHASRLGKFGEGYVLLHDGGSLLGYLPTREIGSNPAFIERLAEGRRDIPSVGLNDELLDEM